MTARYLEDFQAGETIQLGSAEIGLEEMLQFASAYDPQPIHIDAAAARESQFGGVIASGWLTGSLFMRLFVEGVLNRSHAIVSPGLEDLRWLRPVRAGDRLTGRYEVLEVMPSERDPARGTVRARCVLTNQHGEEVFSALARNLFRRRPR